MTQRYRVLVRVSDQKVGGLPQLHSASFDNSVAFCVVLSFNISLVFYIQPVIFPGYVHVFRVCRSDIKVSNGQLIMHPGLYL